MAETLDLRLAVMRCGECGQRFGAEAMFCPFDGAKLEGASWDPAGDPLLGRVIDGRYEVVGVLGEGGMGTVYRVRHTSLDRVFAMKVLRRDLASDPDLAARFTREARATASVKHPNIVAITDFGRIESAPPASDVPYFVMEHLVGRTLAQTLKTGGALPAALGVRIVLKVGAALGAAHAEKIVHRDLKPDNVFVLGSIVSPSGVSSGARDSTSVDVRVVDFGAALILGASRVTKAGVVFGTPHYMSPEQASGQPVDHRADVYALGVIMYEMFTGRVPFVADTYMGVLTQHMFVKPVPPSRVSARARELGALEDVILRALEKKPEHRYATMQELVADIEHVSSFGPDGALRVAPALASGTDPTLSAPPAPMYPLANALEPASREEANASLVTATSARLRRARARAWAAYGGIALGVMALTLGVLRLLEPPRAMEPALSPAAAGSATPPLPSAVGDRSTPGADTPVPSAAPAAPTVAPSVRSASRPPRPSPPKKNAPPLPGDFADPWAK